ncbi:MAG TPA: hypothetical protein VFH90_09635 [Candidatus Limnocylindria bacterium]|nr:hypothetical protein [Candidatus Limnocylindria bacterium]
MSLTRYLLLPVLIVAIGIGYGYWTATEWTGTVLLVVFGGAMAVMGWILLPTLDNVGPTAPVDPDFEDPGR